MDDIKFCDGWSSVGVDHDAFKHGVARLEFSGVDQGCGHCSESIDVTGIGNILRYLEYHEQQYAEQASWFRMVTTMIKEYGEDRIARAILMAYELSGLVSDVAAITRHGQSGGDASLYFPEVKQFSSWHDAADTMLDRAVLLYRMLGTVEKMIVEFFEPHVLHTIANQIGELVNMGYDVTGFPVEENQNE